MTYSQNSKRASAEIEVEFMQVLKMQSTCMNLMPAAGRRIVRSHASIINIEVLHDL